jgi:hypothetical protein
MPEAPTAGRQCYTALDTDLRFTRRPAGPCRQGRAECAVVRSLVKRNLDDHEFCGP